MQPNRPFLIIAQSGRALAASAAKADIDTQVIERFSNQDTCSYASSAQVVAGKSFSVDIDKLLLAIEDLKSSSFSGVVVGSGLEHQPEALDKI
ncbi:MAG: hypothetical protein V3V89_03260, partial [Gammaproteobacteria bacterium]